MVGSGRAFVVASGVLALLVSGCARGGSSGPKNAGPPPLAVDVAAATRQDIATYVALDGQVTPRQESTLSTPQSGTIAAVDVNEGERVHAGQVLARLDASTLQAQLAQNQALVAQAQAHLGSSTLQGPVTAAGAQNTIATAAQQLQAATNSVATAQAALANATLTYNSNRTLLSQGYVSETTYEQSRAAYVAAQQALNNARQQRAQSEVALNAARATSQGAMPIQNQQIAADRATLASAQAAVKLLQTQISQSVLTAPFDGVVTARLLDPGSYASPNAPIVRVSQLDTVYVNINVPDNNLAYLHPGTSVTFTSSSIPDRTFTGTVYDVNATPTTGTLSYRARIIQQNADNTLRGGMLVTVNVRKELHRNAIVVPRTAVFQTENGANVFTVVDLPDDKKGACGGPPPAAAPGAAPAPPAGRPAGVPKCSQAKVLPVQVGLQTDTLTEVRSPDIHAGTDIITTRPDALQDKATVAYVMGAPGSPSGGAGGGGRARGARQVTP